MRYLVVSLLSLVLIGCEPREEQKWECLTCDKRAYLESGDIIWTVDYDGHKFIVLHLDRGGGIIHHPDCNCKERKAK